MEAIKILDLHIKPNPRKVVARFLKMKIGKMKRIGQTLQKLSDNEAQKILDGVLREFEHRHYHFKSILQRHAELAEQKIGNVDDSFVKKQLLGAYVTHEYSIEAAALFNPSIVPHPDQSGLETGALRFIMSLRSVGEGHISSLSFRTGVIQSDGTVDLESDSEKWSCGNITSGGETISDYDIAFDASIPLEGRVIFPHALSESNGIEDVRFVQFSGSQPIYIATYTAYNGREIRSQIIKTSDFTHFQVRELRGKAIMDKGMALFPEKINNQYVMVGRQNGESLSIMHSQDLYKWDQLKWIQHPSRSWELLHIGNCGSPIKTKDGWLLLTHAVGPMRKYVLSATLLDLKNPDIVIASLNVPLISPNEEEREGYVPNVLYTCGWIEHAGFIYLPYAISDSFIGFALIELNDLLQELHASK